MSPETAATGALLWGRAAVLAMFALLTGAVAHVQADGLLPGLPVLGTLVLVGTVACAPLLRREVSTPRVVALLVAGQSAVHVVLAASAGHRGDPASPTASLPARTTVPTVPRGSGGRRGSFYDVAYSAPTPDAPGAEGLSLPEPLLHAVTDVAAHPAMAVAHLLAALACGWWLARGERALWHLLALAGRGWSELVEPLLAAWARVSRVTRPRRLVLAVVPASAPEPRPVLPVLGRSLSRRGPPRSRVGAVLTAA